MSLVEDLGPHLPYLRRYARALTGAQKSGDAYVRAALEAIAAGSQAVESSMGPRVGLYRLFHVIWSSATSPNDRGDDDGSQSPDPEARIRRIPPLSRQSFLLTAVEGFSNAEAAAVMDVSEDELAKLIVAAQREIEDELATEVLIIEDEPIIAVDIEHLVKSMGHDVTAIAATRTEAVTAARSRRPGLVLADIQLADGSSGIDAVADILDEFDVPVIFITAYPERLLTGERLEPAFLISKPFLPDMVKAAIGQALFFHPRAAHVA